MPSLTIPRFTAEEMEWPPQAPTCFEETEDERLERIEREREAQRRSEAIDLQISTEKEQRRKPAAKILLLGQAEAGKSSILKNMQLCFAPKAFRAEAESWRPVIHLNLLRSVNFILDVLDFRNHSPPSPHRQNSFDGDTYFSDEVRRLCICLTPLRQVEGLLTQRISGFIPEMSENTVFPRYHPNKAPEVSIRSGRGWKNLFMWRRISESDATEEYERIQDNSNRRIVSACADDIAALWLHPEIQRHLTERGIALREQPGFFLDDVARITKENYIPTPEDILRARVQTIGPEEHRIPVESEFGREWVVYDVGGSRSQRAAWAQFFDDVTAILFLAPASAYNQVLSEDETVNRMADSMKLWRNLCANRVLQSVQLVLLLNKMDILDAQLKSGIRFAKYVTSYKDRPNEKNAVVKYLTEVFQRLNHQFSPIKRKVYVHTTCATDTKGTSIVISQIQEVLLLKSLADTKMIM